MFTQEEEAVQILKRLDRPFLVAPEVSIPFATRSVSYSHFLPEKDEATIKLEEEDAAGDLWIHKANFLVSGSNTREKWVCHIFIANAYTDNWAQIQQSVS